MKLEYVDETGRNMTPKEAFRQLSHRFHGKGSGKKKTEKRAKQHEQEQVSFCFYFVLCGFDVNYLYAISNKSGFAVDCNEACTSMNATVRITALVAKLQHEMYNDA